MLTKLFKLDELNTNIRITNYFVICALVFVIYLSTGFAEVAKVEFENRHTLKMDIRSDDDDYDFYLTRAQACIDYNFPQINRTIKIQPFFEYQSNFDTDTWWRKEVGAEIGTTFFNDCFYYGASLQHVWQKEENYSVELDDDGQTFEWESRFEIRPPIQWGPFKDRLALRLFNEYTYDFTRGQGTFNQVGVALDWHVFEWLVIPIGWSHMDRIHDFDSDALEFSLIFRF